MKRIILFKGKQVDNGEWIEGFLLKDRSLGNYITEGLGASGIEVHPDTVCQFTGVLDNSGKRIFEGDILNCSDYHDDEPYKTTVRFKDGGFLVDVQRQDYDITCIAFLDDDTEVEIIGNIHD